MKSFNDYIVDTKVLKSNILNIKNALTPGVQCCAVVKANAYGLGIETICKTIKDDVDFFAVACLKEALKIRAIDKDSNILVLGMVDSRDYDLCVCNNITISITNNEQLKLIKGKNISFHLQVNTGLNRFGFKSITEFNKALNYIEKNNLLLKGVYSHFATKARDIQFMNKQFIRFLQFKKLVKISGVVFHIANSFATINNKKFQLDMVRSGFLLYGGMDNNIGNKCVLTIKSKLVNIFKVKKGDTIGYDRTFKVEKKMIIGVVPVGYADGFDRRLSNNFSVLINGYKCRVVGNVCMDVFIVDLTNVSSSIGDEVVILGNQGKRSISLKDYAKHLNTSPYEILLKFNYNRMNYIVL